MRAYLELDEVRQQADAIRVALDELLRRPRVALRPKAKQWCFLRECLEHLLISVDPGTAQIAAPPERSRATQYRFEVQARLRRFYLEAGRPVRYVFELMDQHRALRDGLVDEAYPSVSGYVLLVSPARPEIEAYSQRRELAEYLLRLVHEGAQAELEVYRALPAINLEPLAPYFVTDGPAYLRIQNVAEENAAKGWTIRFPDFNPSTMRLMAARLVERAAASATVRTQEYWYLRWWSLARERYDYIYQETNRQRYFLALREGRWRIESNVYPQPRSTTPRRDPR